MADGADQTDGSGILASFPDPSALSASISPQAADGVQATSKPDTPVPNNPAPDTTNNTDNADSSGDAAPAAIPPDYTPYQPPQPAGAPVPASTPSSSTGAVPANSGGTDSADTQAASPVDGTNDLIRGRAAFICGALVHLGPRPQSDAELADFFNVRPYVIAANPTGFQRRYTIIDCRDAMKDCTVLPQLIVNTPTLGLHIGPDVAHLAPMDQAFHPSPAPQPQRGLLEDAWNSFQGGGSGLLAFASQLDKYTLYGAISRALFPSLAKQEDDFQQFNIDRAMRPDLQPQRWSGQVARIIPFLPAGEAAPFVMGGTSGYMHTKEQEAHNVDPLTAGISGTVDGVLTALTAWLPLGKLVLGEGATAFLTSLLKTTGKAGAAGAVQSIASDEADKLILQAGGHDDLDEQSGPSLEKAWNSALFMGIFHLGTQGIRSVPQLADLYRAAQADAKQQRLNVIDQAAGDSALRAGNPQAFRQLVARMAKGSDLKTLYIDPQALTQAMEKNGVSMSDLNAVMPDMATQLPEAIRNKGYVSFPVDEFATHHAGSAFSADLLPRFKTDPNGMTYAEGQAHIAEQDAKVTARVEKLANDDTARQAWEQSRQAVHDDILSRLNASGKYTPQQAEAGAALQSGIYSAMALNMGVNPEEAYRQFTAPEAGAEAATTPQTDATDSANQAEHARDGAASQAEGEAQVPAFKQSQNAIENSILAKLDAVGRFSHEENLDIARVQTAILSRIAAAEKITPEAAYEKYGADLTGEQSAAHAQSSFHQDNDYRRLRMLMSEMRASHPEVFRSPKSEGKTMAEILDDHLGKDRWRELSDFYVKGHEDATYLQKSEASRRETNPAYDGHTSKWYWIKGEEGPDGKGRSNYIFQHLHDGDGLTHWLNISAAEQGGGGSRIYTALGDYANNTRKVFDADPHGLTENSRLRRTVNMMNIAIRHGTTRWINPGVEQKLDWQENLLGKNNETADRHNFKVLVDSVIKQVETALPETKEVYYDFERRGFYNERTGDPVRGEVFKVAANSGAGRAAKIGPGTIRQAIILKSLLRGENSEARAGIYRAILDGDYLLHGAEDAFYQEGVNGPHPDSRTESEPRGSYDPKTRTIALLKSADASTPYHETGHWALDTYARIAADPAASPMLRADMDAVLKWMDVKDLAAWNRMKLEEQRPYHERFARAFETYLTEGKAPTPQLQTVFQRIRNLLLEIYRSHKTRMQKLGPDIRRVMDRMLGGETSSKARE